MFLLAFVYFWLKPYFGKLKMEKYTDFQNLTDRGDIEEIITKYLNVYDCDDFNLKKEYKWVIPNNIFKNGKGPVVIVYEKTLDKDIIPYFEKMGYQGLFRDHKEINRFITQCVSKEEVSSLRLKPSLSYTFEEYMEMLDLRDKDVLLKMDVYNEDYDMFKSAWEYIRNSVCLILDIKLVKGVEDLFEKLNEEFFLVHIHLNNCNKATAIDINTEKIKGQMTDKLRLVYVKKNRVKCVRLKGIVNIPSELDTPNCIGSDIVLQYLL